jgi:hypothetical protein
MFLHILYLIVLESLSSLTRVIIKLIYKLRSWLLANKPLTNTTNFTLNRSIEINHSPWSPCSFY